MPAAYDAVAAALLARVGMFPSDFPRFRSAWQAGGEVAVSCRIGGDERDDWEDVIASIRTRETYTSDADWTSEDGTEFLVFRFWLEDAPVTPEAAPADAVRSNPPEPMDATMMDAAETPETRPVQTGHVLKTLTKDLAVPLSPSELQAKGERLAELQASLEQHELETKLMSSVRKSEKAAFLADAGKVGLSLRQRSEVRAVTCQEEADFKEGIVRTRRMDSGALLPGVRTLLAEERQGKMFRDGTVARPRRGEQDEASLDASEIVAALGGKVPGVTPAPRRHAEPDSPGGMLESVLGPLDGAADADAVVAAFHRDFPAPAGFDGDGIVEEAPSEPAAKRSRKRKDA